MTPALKHLESKGIIAIWVGNTEVKILNCTSKSAMKDGLLWNYKITPIASFVCKE